MLCPRLVLQNLASELRLWLAAGADPNQTDYDGRTAMHVAASRNNLDALDVLLESSQILFTLKDHWGDTAWTCALNAKNFVVSEAEQRTPRLPAVCLRSHLIPSVMLPS